MSNYAMPHWAPSVPMFVAGTSDLVGWMCYAEHTPTDTCDAYICGDCNGDGVIDLGDVLFLISYLYKGGFAPDPLCIGDASCDGMVDLGDVLSVISYLYKGGPEPCPECCSLKAKIGKFPNQNIETDSPQIRSGPRKLPQAPGGLKRIE